MMAASGEGSSPLSHILQHPLVEKPADLGFLTPKGVVTLLSDQILMLMLAGLLLVVVLPLWVRRRRAKDGVGAMVPAGPGNMIEAVCAYLRKEVAEPNLGPHTDRFIKFIWSTFFFVLVVNLLGILPLGAVTPLALGHHIGGTATGNIWVTATLALVVLSMMVLNGLRLGGMDYIKHFNPGPIWLAPLLVPLEILGTLFKAGALAIRLFANMIAGHILLAVLLSFILSVGQKSVGGGLGVAAVVVPASVAINLLEIFVCFLQAFIFTFLTTLFIGMSVNVHHEEHGH
jgi:F-type H+-transporting ATPase subunit a